jgi:hypothetical protein
MSYYEEALPILKRLRPTDVPEFQMKYSSGKAKILFSEYLFRLMLVDEAAIWNKVAPPGSIQMQPAMMKTLFVGGGGYTSKWFTFDRPYLFTRQKLNTPGGREGQGFLMTIPLGHEMKNTLIKKMLPDVSLQGLPEALKSDSCRCKVESGTITLGISMPVLEKIAINMSIEHLGGRITP